MARSCVHGMGPSSRSTMGASSTARRRTTSRVSSCANATGVSRSKSRHRRATAPLREREAPRSSSRHEREDTGCPARRPNVRRRSASDAPTEHLPILLGGNEPRERADSRQHRRRRHPCQHRRCGIRACQLSRRGRALVRVPRTGGRAYAGHVALLLERSARSDAGRDRSSGLLLPFPRCHDRPARVAL